MWTLALQGSRSAQVGRSSPMCACVAATSGSVSPAWRGLVSGQPPGTLRSPRAGCLRPLSPHCAGCLGTEEGEPPSSRARGGQQQWGHIACSEWVPDLRSPLRSCPSKPRTAQQRSVPVGCLGRPCFPPLLPELQLSCHRWVRPRSLKNKQTNKQTTAQAVDL